MRPEKRKDDIKIQGIYDYGYGIVAKMVMCDSSISIGAKALYSYICTFAGAEKKAWPGRAKICSDLGISKDSFSKYLNELKTHNYIVVRNRKNEKGQFLGNIYIIVTQLEDPQNKKPCPKISDMDKPCPKIPCPENPDTVQKPINSNSAPCPKNPYPDEPCPGKPCPVNSDTNINRSLNITSIKKQQRDPDQVAEKEPGPDSFFHKPAVVSSRKQKKEKQRDTEGISDIDSVRSSSEVNFESVVSALIKYGVDNNKAEELAGSFSAERIKQVLNYTNSKKPTNTSGYIISALENGWSIPEEVSSQGQAEEKKDFLRERTKEILKNLKEAQKNAAPLSVQAEQIGAILSQFRCPSSSSIST